MAWIYIIHFDTPLEHAKHYCGCTEHLIQRLERHANGAGSNLCRVLRTKGIEWTLGALAQCTKTEMRRQERKLKEIGHTPRYCEICSKPPARLRGTTPYPVASITLPVSSEELRRTCNTPPPVIIRTADIHDGPATMEQVKWLMRADKDALGYIPAGGDEGLSTLIKYGRLILAETIPTDTCRQKRIVGFAAFTFDRKHDEQTIHQVCVDDTRRLEGIGTKLVAAAVAAQPATKRIAKVRNDLAANDFWESIGWPETTWSIHETSKNRLNHHRHDS